MIIDTINWFLSLRRNSNFWQWVRDTYSLEDLIQLYNESTDCSLTRPYNPMADVYVGQKDLMRKTVKRLIKRYGDEIWSCCLGAGDYNPENGETGIKCLSKLDLAFQVYNQVTFEEFLVRNALKFVAKQEIEKTNNRNKNQEIHN